MRGIKGKIYRVAIHDAFVFPVLEWEGGKESEIYSTRGHTYSQKLVNCGKMAQVGDGQIG